MALNMDRLESLMDSFYGMNEETVEADAHNIDSAGFSVSEVAADVLTHKSLPELMGYTEGLKAETRDLDGKMQDLVYNNYTKFISATETIRRMKDSVTEMEAKMDTLTRAMQAMGGSSALVNANLSENRSKIEKLVGIKRLLLKLAFLFELPVRLKRSIELDAPSQAVSYYCMVSGVLRKYDNIPSLHKIRVEADAIMNGLKNDLRGILREGGPSAKAGAAAPASSGRVVEAISMLVQLEEPRPALRSAYLALQRSRLLNTLKQFAARYAPVLPPAAPGSVPTPLAAPSGADGSSLLSARAQAMYKAALDTQTTASAAAAARAAMTSPRPRASASAYSFMQALNRAFIDAFKNAADHYVELFEESETAAGGGGPDERRAAHEQLIAFAKDVLSEYFSLVRSQLSLPPPPPGTPSATPETTPAAGAAGGSRATGKKDKDKSGETAGEAASKKSNPFLTRKAGAAAARANEEEDNAEAAAAEAKAAALAAAAALSEQHSDGRFGPLIDALNLFLMDMRSAERHVREAALKDRAHEVTEAVIRAQLDGLFADVRSDVVHLLGTLQTTATTLVEEERAKAVRAAAGLSTSTAPAASSATASSAAAPEASPAAAPVPPRAAGNPFGGATAAETAAAPPAGAAAGNPFGAPSPAPANPFGAAAASPAAGNPFGAPSPASTSAPAASPAAGRPSGSMASAAVPGRYDWLQTVGAGLSASAEQASFDVSRRLDEALHESKPLLLSGIRQLPDLAHVFNALLNGQVLHMLMWLASAWEALGDAFHPCRAQFADVVVTADLGLERELMRTGRPGGGRVAGPGGAGASRAGASPAGGHAAAMKRRVTVNFAAAEADSGGAVNAESYSSGAALLNVERDPAFLLLLAHLCRHFSSNGVTHALDTMLKSLPSRADLQAIGVRFGENEVEALGSMADVPDLIKRMQAAGRELLRRFVYQHATRLSNVIRRSMVSAEWRSHTEPRQVRMVVQLVLEDVAQIKKLAACTLGDWDSRTANALAAAFGVGSTTTSTTPAATNANPFAAPSGPVSLRGGPALAGSNPSTLAAAQAARRTGLIVGAAGLSGGFGSLSSFGGAPGAGGLGATGGRGLHMDIERLFRGAGDSGALHIVLGAVDYSSSAVVRVLLRVLFKTWAEWARTCTFSAGGYQQMQVDTAALHLALPYFTARSPPPGGASGAAPSIGAAAGSMVGGYDPYEGASQLEELLNEVAASSAERCLEPTPLESSIVYTLASGHLSKLNFAL